MHTVFRFFKILLMKYKHVEYMKKLLILFGFICFVFNVTYSQVAQINRNELYILVNGVGCKDFMLIKRDTLLNLDGIGISNDSVTIKNFTISAARRGGGDFEILNTGNKFSDNAKKCFKDKGVTYFFLDRIKITPKHSKYIYPKGLIIYIVD